MAGTQRVSVTALVSRLSAFLAGNSLVQGINLFAGLIVLWHLPIDEYALYVTASALIAVGSVGSDPGISQAILTLGSRALGQRRRVSQIFATAWMLRGRLLLVVSAAVVAVLAVVGSRQHWSTVSWVVLPLLVIGTNWAQLRQSAFVSLFNIHHDTRSIVLSSALPAILRLVLTWVLCRTWPNAAMALTINLIALVLQDRIAAKFSHAHLDRSAVRDPAIQSDIARFVLPLVPGVVYYLLQGQIAIYLLTWTGQTAAIAEVGALGRLQQVFMMLSALNGFFVQPYFARIADAVLFRRRLWLLAVCLAGLCLLAMLSACVLDAWWVSILGPRYANLQQLIPLTMAGCLLIFTGTTAYTVVIATSQTRFQWLQIPAGLGAQGAVLAWVGVQSTRDALLVSYAPALSYLLLQIFLIVLFPFKKDRP